MSNKIQSLIFDFFQVGSIAFILLTGPVIASKIILLIFQILAMIILLVSAFSMRRTKYYRVPDVGKQSELVNGGIYKYIRNPMYLSELIFCGIMVVNFFSIYRLLVYLIFLTNFIYKIQYEERLLSGNFKEFREYQKTTWRLIPFIY